MPLSTIRYLFCLLAAILITGCGSDSEEDINQTQKKLKIISQAIKKFKSEEYFGKPPSNLQELYQYNTTYFNVPNQSSVYNKTEKAKPETFIEANESYSLIPNKHVFLKSGMSEKDENKRLTESEFVCDFGFIKDYQLFAPSNTIIAWDKAGNFNSGGNILFEDGRITFITASAAEYERFAIALETQTDRDFVRDLCLRNNTDCSLANLKNTSRE